MSAVQYQLGSGAVSATTSATATIRGVSRSVERLAAWYARLDRELQTVLEGLEEADLARSIDRDHGFAPPVPVQFHIYREALLIFCAKAHVYLKALGKRVTGPWQWWIGDRADYESIAE